MNGSGAPCFLLELTDSTRRSLRRSVWSGQAKCPGPMSYHDASVVIDIVPRTEKDVCGDRWPHDDPRWPLVCSCGYEFIPSDEWQLHYDSIWRRGDTGAEMVLSDAPPGAMWYADWNTWDIGPDGRCLMVRLPDGHDWTVDSEANNCTRKGDRSHKCWVRHGTPPNVTVDKNGNTCSAGAGSIATRKWHGFLRNGVLVPC